MWGLIAYGISALVEPHEEDMNVMIAYERLCEALDRYNRRQKTQSEFDNLDNEPIPPSSGSSANNSWSNLTSGDASSSDEKTVVGNVLGIAYGNESLDDEEYNRRKVADDDIDAISLSLVDEDN